MMTLEDRLTFREALLSQKTEEEWKTYRPYTKQGTAFYSSQFTLEGETIIGKELIERYASEFPSDRNYSIRAHLNRMFSECQVPQFTFSDPEVLRGFLLSAKSPTTWENEGIKSRSEFQDTEFQYSGFRMKGKMLAYNIYIELENKKNGTFYSFGDYLQNPSLRKELGKACLRDFYIELFGIARLKIKKGKPLSAEEITPENLRQIFLSVMDEDNWSKWAGSNSDFGKLQFELNGYEQFSGFSLMNSYAKKKGKGVSIKDMFEEAQIRYDPERQRRIHVINEFQERTDHLFNDPNYLRKSLLELMTIEEWGKPKEFQDVRLRRISFGGSQLALHTLMHYYCMHKYNAQQEVDNMICFGDREYISAFSSRAVLDEILDVAGIRNRWIPTFEDVDLKDPNFIRRVLLNAEFDGEPISLNEIRNMGSEWRKVRVKDPEIGFDKVLRSLVQYFTAYEDWQEHPEHSLNYVVQTMKKGKIGKKNLEEVLSFAGF